MKKKHSFFFIFIIVMLLLQLNCSTPPQDEDSPITRNLSPGFEKRIKKIGEISDVFKIPSILVDQSQVYIWDKFLCKIGIYSKKDMSKIAEFGKRGQGPQEFSGINSVSIDDNFIYINSHPKLSIFNKDGSIVKEIKTSSMTGSFKPIGNNYIGKKYFHTPKDSPTHKIGFLLHDSELAILKDILVTEYSKSHIPLSPTKTKVLLFTDCCKGIVYKDKFYFGSSHRGFYFVVFDSHGNTLYEIDRPYKKIPVTDDIKSLMMAPVNNSKRRDEYYKKYEPSFPEFFPAFANFAIGNDMIYVFKFPEMGSKSLAVEVLDLQGNLKKTLHIPSFLWRGIMKNNFSFYEGKVYFLEMSKENEENLEFYECNLDT